MFKKFVAGKYQLIFIHMQTAWRTWKNAQIRKLQTSNYRNIPSLDTIDNDWSLHTNSPHVIFSVLVCDERCLHINNDEWKQKQQLYILLLQYHCAHMPHVQQQTNSRRKKKHETTQQNINGVCFTNVLIIVFAWLLFKHVIVVAFDSEAGADLPEKKHKQIVWNLKLFAQFLEYEQWTAIVCSMQFTLSPFATRLLILIYCLKSQEISCFSAYTNHTDIERIVESWNIYQM